MMAKRKNRPSPMVCSSNQPQQLCPPKIIHYLVVEGADRKGSTPMKGWLSTTPITLLASIIGREPIPSSAYLRHQVSREGRANPRSATSSVRRFYWRPTPDAAADVQKSGFKA